MPKRQSLYAKYPGYSVELEANSERVRVSLGGETIADSSKTLNVLEGRYDPVVYFPREDVRMDLLERTDHETFCPFKGEAAYWTIRVGDRGLPALQRGDSVRLQARRCTN